jgi:hypothetical protein
LSRITPSSLSERRGSGKPGKRGGRPCRGEGGASTKREGANGMEMACKDWESPLNAGVRTKQSSH